MFGCVRTHGSRPNTPLHTHTCAPTPQGIGMNVMAYDIRPNPRVEAMGIKYYPWEDILPAADMVSLHLPLLPSTKYFIDVRGGGGRSIKHKTWGPGRAGGGGLGAAPLTVPRWGLGWGRGRARQRRRRPRTTHHPLVTPSPALAPPPPPGAQDCHDEAWGDAAQRQPRRTHRHE